MIGTAYTRRPSPFIHQLHTFLLSLLFCYQGSATMAVIGLSPGDFYFVITLVGKVVASFRDNPQGAVQQYSAFSTEIQIISSYFEDISNEETELVTLWKETKAQCVHFATKYASLDTEDIPEREKIWDWLWMYWKTNKAINTVRWSLDGRQEAAELQQKVARIIHLASLNLIIENQTSLRHVETFLRVVNENLSNIQNVIRQVDPLYRCNRRETNPAIF